MKTLESQIDHIRGRFPALARRVDGRAAVFLDGPAGTQVPQRVIDAVSGYLATANANHGGLFATSRESDAMLQQAHRAVADLLAADDPDCVSFGPNMTTLTFALSRALARTWRPGDEVLVTRLDHDANVTPWVLAAGDAGARVQFVEIRRQDCTLELDDLRAKLTSRTRLVAVGCASNSVGTINPVRQICAWAREAALCPSWTRCIMRPCVGRCGRVRLRLSRLLRLQVLRPPRGSALGPARVAGVAARLQSASRAERSARQVDDRHPEPRRDCRNAGSRRVPGGAGRELAEDRGLDRRTALRRAFAAIGDYERGLISRLIAGLSGVEAVSVRGITDPSRMAERLPTISLTHARRSPPEVAMALGTQGIFVWHGNYYALQLTEALGLEPGEWCASAWCTTTRPAKWIS